MISCSLCYVSLRLILLAEVAEAVCSLTIAVNRTVEELSFRAVTGRAAAAWGLFAHLLVRARRTHKKWFLCHTGWQGLGPPPPRVEAAERRGDAGPSVSPAAPAGSPSPERGGAGQSCRRATGSAARRRRAESW